MLRSAETTAICLEQITGDSLPAKEVSQAKEMGYQSKNRPLSLLLSGILHYSEGQLRYSHADYKASERKFAQARNELAQVNSVLFARAEMAQACALHYLSKYPAALSLFRSVKGHAVKLESRALEGDSLWMQGLTHFAMGSLAEARYDYETALKHFESGKDPAKIAGIENLLAELFGRARSGRRCMGLSLQSIGNISKN